MSLSCSWCGIGVDDDEGFRAAEPAGERVAAFCRLEHVAFVIAALEARADELGLSPRQSAA